MPITEWPEEDRPWEKLLTRGAQTLTDAELLAIFLRTGTAGKSAVDLAWDLLVELWGDSGVRSARTRRAFARPRAWARPNMPSCRPCWP